MSNLYILARQNGNAIQYVQVTKTGGTKIVTDPSFATRFKSQEAAKKQKKHAPKKLKNYKIIEQPGIIGKCQTEDGNTCCESEKGKADILLNEFGISRHTLLEIVNLSKKMGIVPDEDEENVWPAAGLDSTSADPVNAGDDNDDMKIIQQVQSTQSMQPIQPIQQIQPAADDMPVEDTQTSEIHIIPEKRKQFSKTIRNEVYNRAEGRCAICGEFIPYDAFTIDHIHPLSRGGKNTIDNLQCACRFCNQLKGFMEDEEMAEKIETIVLSKAQKDEEFRKRLRKKLKKSQIHT